MSIVIRGILEEEKERLVRLVKRYSTDLEDLPKGSLRIRELKGHKYAYLVYREGQKVVNKYLGNASRKDVQELQERVEKAKTIRQLKKDAMASIKEIEGMLRGRSGRTV